MARVASDVVVAVVNASAVAVVNASPFLQSRRIPAPQTPEPWTLLPYDAASQTVPAVVPAAASVVLPVASVEVFAVLATVCTRAVAALSMQT